MDEISMQAGTVLNIFVNPGDTLFTLSQIFRITVQQILTANPGLTMSSQLSIGQLLIIPAAPPVPPNPGTALAQYLVRPGDTIFAIAKRLGLTVALLTAANPQIPNINRLSINQVINLTVTPPLPQDIAGTFRIYVRGGETLRSIAQRTGVTLDAIISVNPQITDPNRIFVGQIVNVPFK
jgi:LysM repeat protein